MTTITTSRPSHVVSDAIIMLRRNLLHMIRYPGLSMFTILGPVIALLLFVFVFGGTLGAGLPGVDTAGIDTAGADAASGRDAYLAYVVPGILVITIAGTAAGTATTVSMDMTEGITARFRTMQISRASVLAGHVLGNAIQGIIAVALVLAVSVAVGFRPSAAFGGWLAAVGLISLVAFAITWLGVAMGIQAKSVETASNLPLILTILPMLGSGLVPTASMPGWLQWFAQYQPFTAFVEAIRGLLLGTALDGTLLIAVAWSVAISLIGYVWSMVLYERRSVR
jgi:ABC-2 type transport system permease protein